jgi:hypothetical protein
LKEDLSARSSSASWSANQKDVELRNVSDAALGEPLPNGLRPRAERARSLAPWNSMRVRGLSGE